MHIHTHTHTHPSMIAEIVCQDNRVKLRRCQIEFISFSAHVDYTQNSAFIRTVSTYAHHYTDEMIFRHLLWVFDFFLLSSSIFHYLLLIIYVAVFLLFPLKIRKFLYMIFAVSLCLHLSLNNSHLLQIQPDNIILVHGERTGMGRLKSQLER